MTLGDKIASARRERNLTQEAFADILEVSRQAVSRWESDLAYPEMEKLVKVCSTLELSCDYLLKKDGDGSDISEGYVIASKKRDTALVTPGGKISAARRRMNLTQEQLAGLIGVSRQAVSRWESDTAYPETDKIVKLCNALEINCDYLLKDDVTERGIKIVERVVEKEVIVERVVEKTVYINASSDNFVYGYMQMTAACTPAPRQKLAATQKVASFASRHSVILGACSLFIGAVFLLFGVVNLGVAMYWGFGSILPLMLLWLSVGIGAALLTLGVRLIRNKTRKKTNIIATT